MRGRRWRRALALGPFTLLAVPFHALSVHAFTLSVHALALHTVPLALVALVPYMFEDDALWRWRAPLARTLNAHRDCAQRRLSRDASANGALAFPFPVIALALSLPLALALSFSLPLPLSLSLLLALAVGLLLLHRLLRALLVPEFHVPARMRWRRRWGAAVIAFLVRVLAFARIAHVPRITHVTHVTGTTHLGIAAVTHLDVLRIAVAGGAAYATPNARR